MGYMNYDIDILIITVDARELRKMQRAQKRARRKAERAAKRAARRYAKLAKKYGL